MYFTTSTIYPTMGRELAPQPPFANPSGSSLSHQQPPSKFLYLLNFLYLLSFQPFAHS